MALSQRKAAAENTATGKKPCRSIVSRTPSRRLQRQTANNAVAIPRSRGFTNGTCGNGLAVPSEATLATKVQTSRPALKIPAATFWYALGDALTGHSLAAAGRGSQRSRSAGTTSQPSHGQALLASP